MIWKRKFWQWGRVISLLMLAHVLLIPLSRLYARSETGQDSLCEAASMGDLLGIRFLLAAGADPNGDGWLFTPLGSAAAGGQLEAARLLLASGADPSRLVNKDKPQTTAAKLFKAPTEEHLQVIALLRSAGGH